MHEFSFKNAVERGGGSVTPQIPFGVNDLKEIKAVHRFCDLFFELAMQISGQNTWKAGDAPCWQDEAEFGKWLLECARACGV